MWRKMTVILASALLVFAAGCGAVKKGEESGGTNTGTETAKQVKIEFFNQKNEVKDFVAGLIKEFEQENSNIKVELISVPDSRTVLNSRMASNDLPDIMSLFPNETDFKVQAAEGFFMDLTGEELLKTVRPNFLEEVKLDGKDYSVPLTLNAYGIFYNADKFAELGLTPPATIDELKATAQTIKDKGLIPFASSFKEAWTTGQISEAFYGNLVDVKTAREFFTDPSKKAEDNPVLKELAEVMDFFMENAQPQAAGAGYADAVSLFAKGEALMLPQGIWAVPMIEQAGPSFEFKMFPTPGKEADKSRVIYGIDYALAASKDTKHPEEVKAFLAFMTKPETAKKLLEFEKSPSTIEGVDTEISQTNDVTKLIYEQDRSFQWLHFDWKPGMEPIWHSLSNEYFITKDKDKFYSNINKEFEKK